MEQKVKLTKEMAIEEVSEIRKIWHDDEVAHSREDELYFRFISCIADGMYDKSESIEIANIVRQTSLIDFSRHCA